MLPAIHPKYVFGPCVVIAVIAILAQVLLRIAEPNPFANAIGVGGLAAVSVLYKSWFENSRRQSRGDREESVQPDLA